MQVHAAVKPDKAIAKSAGTFIRKNPIGSIVKRYYPFKLHYYIAIGLHQQAVASSPTRTRRHL
jgi:hypothetical protein